MVAIYEKLRPKTIDEFIGFSQQIASLDKLNEILGWSGQVFWITGYSGTGKTTLARIIANKVSGGIDIDEIDGQDLSVDKIREIVRMAHYMPMCGESYAVIVNEAHTLGTKSISMLQTALEEPHVQKNVTWAFTTTIRGQQHLFDNRLDAFPFLSRAIMIDLKPDEDTVQQFAEYLYRTSGALGLNGKTLRDYKTLLVECKCNLRQALQQIVSGKMAA